MLPQFFRRARHIAGGQQVHDPLVAVDPGLPFRRLDAFAEPVKEHIQQLAKRRQRRSKYGAKRPK
jgi:hypothetical protein